MRSGGADDQHAERVADELAGFAVVEELRVAGEDVTLLRSVDVVFEGGDAGALHEDEDLVEHAQVAQEGLAAVLWSAEGVAGAGYHFADQIGAVGDEDGAGRGADHDQQLRGLEEDPRVPMLEQVAA